MKKLNIGCGLSVQEDWINIDNSFNAKLAKHPRFKYILFKIGILPRDFYYVDWPQDILTHNIKKGLPYNDEEVDYIFTSHFIEHLKKNEAEKFFDECLRVLKPDGLIRITTPDLQLLVRTYQDEFEKGTVSASLDLFNQIKSTEKRKNFLINLMTTGSKHWMIYDELSLSSLLKSAGFREILKQRYREGEMPDIDFLDNRPDESLYMEARK